MRFKTRTKYHPEQRYLGIFDGRFTQRFSGEGKPILGMPFPEIEDVSLGTKCLANCPFCYTSAIKQGEVYPNVVEKIKNHYGNLTLNQRPFQVAIGGGGEPTIHPDFIEVLKTFRSLEIVPNYTTNGMHLTEEILDASKEFCGGVAVSCHPHLEKTWRKAIVQLLDKEIFTCLHIIVGEEKTSDRFWEIYDEYKNDVKIFVMLPYVSAGRAKQIETEVEWNNFFSELLKRKAEGRDCKNIAFGAHLYQFFLKHPGLANSVGAELYEPEVMSGYRILDDSYRTLRTSSYNLEPKKTECLIA